MESSPTQTAPTSGNALGGAPLGRIWRLLRLLVVVYLGIVVLMIVLERSMIFYPMPYPQGDWENLPAGVEDVEFAAGDGTQLHGWYAPHDDPLAVVLYAHGNAGNLTHRRDVLQTLHRDLDCTVLLFDYRGYGKSGGKPDEAGVLLDGRAARDHLAELAGVDADAVVLMGRSLGTAVAVDLAAGEGARAVVLHSGFPSLPDVAACHFPWLPVRWLMRTRFHSLARIQDYHGPLLQAHGESDEIIPAELGRQLFAAAPMEHKRWVSLGPRGHNDPVPQEFYDVLREFLTDLSNQRARQAHEINGTQARI